MTDRNQYKLGDAIGLALKSLKLDDKLTEIQLFEKWAAITGKPIAEATIRLMFKNGVLTVFLNSPSLKKDLLLSRGMIADKLNMAMGRELVTKVLVR